MNEFRSKDRSSSFTKDECQHLQQLVFEHKNILMCKKTDGSLAANKKKIHGDDALENPPESQKELDQTITLDAAIDPSNESVNIEDIENNIHFDSSTPYSSLNRPVATPLKRLINKNDNVIKMALRKKKLSLLDGLSKLELEKIKLSISNQNELHEQLLKHNEEKHKLEIIKLQLEIDILQKKNTSYE